MIIRKTFVALILCIISIFALVGCSGINDTAMAEDTTYSINVPGYEDIYQEKIKLSGIAYNSSFIRASISGKFYVPSTNLNQKYTIVDLENGSTFEQVYGHIWKVEVSVEETDQCITIYASRKGESPTGKTKKIMCGDREVSGVEYKKYSTIKYLFCGECDYLAD